MLRTGGFPPPTRTIRTEVAIVGGGMAGLSAGWRLQKRGVNDFWILELEPEVGGNARSGTNATGAYPWGAHYLPIPDEESVWVQELLTELGVLQGHDARGLPLYDEFALCAEPQERLLVHGLWQDGLVPRVGLSPDDEAQFAAFFAEMERLRGIRGRDGRRAFTIPLELSSRDPEFLALDALTMAAYMDRHGWTSPALRWYVEYGCRDDFGCRLDTISAWAGIHYFAGRSGRAGNAEPRAVLTWPEGMGWIVAQLKRKMLAQLRTDALVHAVRITSSGEVELDSTDPVTRETTRIHARTAILATPRFVAARLLEPLREQPPAYLSAFSYAPWMVANLTVDRRPGGRGAPLSWDNVAMDSPSLGYVVASHQQPQQSPPGETVLTYYRPLDDTDPAEARTRALSRSQEDWATEIVADLERMHPGIGTTIRHLDVWIWGHAMARPVPGFLWGEARRQALEPLGPVSFAHSDMSGLSIFEEAQYRGVLAADRAVSLLQGKPA